MPEDDIEDAKDGPAYFAEIHQLIRTRTGDQHPRYSANYTLLEYEKALSKIKDRVSFRQALPWKERGPGNVAGRTRGLLLDPDDPDYLTWYVGSVGGGVWKTSDGGQTWNNLTDGLPVQSTSHLAMARSNPDIIYLGTGEGYSTLANVTGNGIFKSLDRGNSWTQLPNTANDQLKFGNVLRIVVNPNNEDEVIVCTNASLLKDLGTEPFGYIQKSIDGGQTWEVKYSTPRLVPQVFPNPRNFNTLYATENGQALLRSTDGGETWDAIYDFSNKRVGRMEMVIHPIDTNIIYISAQDVLDDFALYKSSDAGFSWSKVSNQNGIKFTRIFNGQGWYDNTIAIHPFNPTIVYVGGAGPIVRINTQEGDKNVEINEVINNAGYLRDVPVLDGATGIYPFTSDAAQALGINNDLSKDRFVDFELRFGDNRNQQAHRFFFGGQGEPIVVYEDFTNIPLEVWDIENNRQLAVAFVDGDRNGQYNIRQAESPDVVNEFLVVYDLPYDSLGPNELLTNNRNDNAMFIVFLGARDQNLDLTQVQPGTLEVDVNINIPVGGQMTPIVDGYSQFTQDFPGVGAKGVHVDHHNIILIPQDLNGEQLYLLNANDGGIAFSTDNGETFIQTGGTVRETGSNVLLGLNTAQFYGLDKMNGGIDT